MSKFQGKPSRKRWNNSWAEVEPSRKIWDNSWPEGIALSQSSQFDFLTW